MGGLSCPRLIAVIAPYQGPHNPAGPLSLSLKSHAMNQPNITGVFQSHTYTQLQLLYCTNYQLPTHQLFNNTHPSQTWYAPLLKRGKGRLIVTTQGKRKSAAKPQGPRKNEPLATIFPCLFCNHEKSVSVKLEKKMGVGTLNCKVCNQQFQCAVNCTFSDPFPFMVLRSKKAQ